MPHHGLKISTHAIEQSRRRTGLGEDELVRAIATRLARDEVYLPEPRPDMAPQRWVAIDGPTGKGTAILVEERTHTVVVTVREAETCTQSERANERLTHRPFAALRSKRGKK